MAPLIRYFKADPTEYLLAYANGRVRRAGAGLAFFYWVPSTSLALVPTSTQDAPFILNETTGNFQALTVQGQLTYRIVEPGTTAAILNFTVDPLTRAPRSTDPDKLPQRLVNAVQTHLRPELADLSLEEALRRGASLAGRAHSRPGCRPTRRCRPWALPARAW